MLNDDYYTVQYIVRIIRSYCFALSLNILKLYRSDLALL